VSYINNTAPGTASIIISSADVDSPGYSYTGTLTGKFKIAKGKVLNEDDFTFLYSSSVPYSKSGAVLKDLVIKDDEKILKEGTDYVVKCGRNKAVTDYAVATVTGKGNYKGRVDLYYSVEEQDIEADGFTILVSAISDKKGRKAPVVTVTDRDGKLLTKADYDVYITAPDENDVLTAIVDGKGCYYGEVEVSFKYTDVSKQLAKVGMRKSGISPKVYSGSEVVLSKDDLKGLLYYGSRELILGKDFRIVSYTGNNKAGAAKVTLQGIGEFGGTRILAFKITTKPGNYAGALVGGGWKK
ncbi:MAG: hypothetical protein IK111_10840, partial [Lachnospiraceae bacterium]|nr:hypothetical protein [Lachnospiraceae bacterium]